MQKDYKIFSIILIRGVADAPTIVWDSFYSSEEVAQAIQVGIFCIGLFLMYHFGKKLTREVKFAMYYATYIKKPAGACSEGDAGIFVCTNRNHNPGLECGYGGKGPYGPCTGCYQVVPCLPVEYIRSKPAICLLFKTFGPMNPVGLKVRDPNYTLLIPPHSAPARPDLQVQTYSSVTKVNIFTHGGRVF
jgi:hypothetical protein